MSTLNERQQQIAALIEAGKTNKEIVAEASCSSSTVSAVRALLAGGAAAPKRRRSQHVVEQPEEPEEGGDAEEVTQEIEYLRHRVTELTEHIADLSMEHVRISRLLREQQGA